MAFCPLCGKKLPDNGICPCGRKLDANGNIVSNAVQEVVPDAAALEKQKRYETQMSTLQQAYNSALTSEDKAKIKQTMKDVEASYKKKSAAAPAAPQPQQVQQPIPQPAPQYQATVQPQAAPQPQQVQQPVPQPIPQYQATVQPQAAPQPQQVQVQPQQMQQPVQPMPQQAPSAALQPAPVKPAGPNPFGEAFKTFGSYFVNPAGTRDKVLDGKVSIGAGLILGGLYFLVLWISMTLLLSGNGGHLKFLPAFGFGILAAIVFCGLKCGAAGLILLLSKRKGTGFARILATLCVDTVLADCILIIMSLFQFATMHFAVFFMLIYLALILYGNFETLRTLSTDASDNKLFWNNLVMICAYAFILMISYIIFCNIPASAYSISSIFSW